MSNFEPGTIDYLEEMSYSIGVSFPVATLPMVIAIDVVLIPIADTGEMYFGINRFVGVGTPGVGAHIMWGSRSTVERTRVNLIDLLFS